MDIHTFDYSRLRGKIREKYATEANFAAAMGMSKTTISAKLNQISDFTQSEILRAAMLLGVDSREVTDYFFSPSVQKN